MMLRFNWRALPLAAFLLVLCARPTRAADKSNFRTDVMRCEDAVAHLVSCCPHFDPSRLHCVFAEDDGCDASVRDVPVLSESESECIVATPCDELVSRRVCARAQSAQETGDSPCVDGEQCVYPALGVCP